MIFQNLTNALAERAEVVKTNAQAHSPEILIGVGIAGMVTSTVLACRATLKAKDVVEKRKSDLAELREVKEAPENADGALYSDDQYKKDTRLVNFQTGMKVVGLYLPAVTVGILGASCFIKSNDIHRKHEASLTAAYMSVDQMFKKYRERVKEELGEDADDRFRYGTRTIEVEKEVVDENGKVKKKKEQVDVIDDFDTKDFSILWDRKSEHWDNDPHYQQSIVKDAMSNLNIRLKHRAKLNHGVGYLRITEVYDELLIPRPKFIDEELRDFGWVLDYNDPVLGGTEINLNPKVVFLPPKNEEVCPRRAILLQPNVQGNIFELMR